MVAPPAVSAGDRSAIRTIMMPSSKAQLMSQQRGKWHFDRNVRCIFVASLLVSLFQIRRKRPTHQSALLIAIMLVSLNLCGQSRPIAKQLHTTPQLPPEEIFKRGSRSIYVVEAVNIHGDVLLQQNGVAISQHVIASTRNILESVVNPGSRHTSDDWIARYRIRQGHRTWNVANVFIDMQRDLSTFESPDLDASPIQLGSSNSLSIGERVYAINYPKGQEQTLTEGVITELHISDKAKIISTSVSLSEESAGSGLFDPRGKLIGIIVFDPVKSLNTALPAEWAKNPSVLFSGKPASNETPVDHGKLWDRSALLKENIQTFAFSQLLKKTIGSDPTGEKTQNTIYHSDDDNAAIIRITDSLFLPDDSPEKFDNWPTWRQSSAYMEDLRSVMLTTSKNGVPIFVDDGRKLWSDILDVYCQELPGAPYTDLEGKIRSCAMTQ